MPKIFFLVILILLPHLGAQNPESWPQFRGPRGDGHSSARDLPLNWSETKNIAWKTPIHGRGWSSPIIYGDQIWVTTATPDGHRLSALCIDKNTGRILKDMMLFFVEKPQFCHSFNTYASPTPVIEEGRIYLTFGSPGTACVDTRNFRVVWERRDFECNHFRGAGSSPILFQELLIMNFDGSDHQFVVALDKRTGKTVWRTDRSIDFQDLDASGKPEAEGDYRKAFSTPQVVRVDGRPELISLGSKAAYAYDPRTGREIWRMEERGQHSASTRPVVGHGMIFYPTGFAAGQVFGLRMGGRGILADGHVAWKLKRGAPNKPSLLLVDDLIYMVNDVGITTCVEAKTGEIVWQSRVEGSYSASPIYADGKIWFFSEEGKTTVLQPGRVFKILAENHLDDGFMGSPAALGKALYLRTKKNLYRLENRP